MRGVLPAMMAQRYGKIVNGTFGTRGRAGRMAYSASKSGLRGITESFALEVGSYNININCIAPDTHGWGRSVYALQNCRSRGSTTPTTPWWPSCAPRWVGGSRQDESRLPCIGSDERAS